MDCEALQDQIHQGIPLSRQMAFHVLELSGHHIRVYGGAAENVNVHGTAFAGSLYSICTLAGWGLTFSLIPENTVLVMEKASIHYLRPVSGDIIAECGLAPEQLSIFLGELDQRGKARLELEVTIEVKQKMAVKFNAQLYVGRSDRSGGLLLYPSV